MTVEEYLEAEEACEERFEFLDREMVAVGYGGLRHSLIVTNVAAAIHAATRGSSCLTFGPNIRVCIDDQRLVAYPDVTVICGPPEYLDAGRRILKHPTVVVEVLSPSTRNFDLGEKAKLYRRLPSLREFLIVEQERVFVEHYRRLEDGSWQIVVHAEANPVIRLDSLGAEVVVAELYAGVDAL
jgi:Uma2 family endonuclease